MSFAPLSDEQLVDAYFRALEMLNVDRLVILDYCSRTFIGAIGDLDNLGEKGLVQLTKISPVPVKKRIADLLSSKGVDRLLIGESVDNFKVSNSFYLRRENGCLIPLTPNDQTFLREKDRY